MPLLVVPGTSHHLSVACKSAPIPVFQGSRPNGQDKCVPTTLDRGFGLAVAGSHHLYLVASHSNPMPSQGKMQGLFQGPWNKM